MFRRKKLDEAAIRAQIVNAKVTKTQADIALAHVQSQRPRVDSLVSYLVERREQNGFGEDFTIATTPRI